MPKYKERRRKGRKESEGRVIIAGESNMARGRKGVGARVKGTQESRQAFSRTTVRTALNKEK